MLSVKVEIYNVSCETRADYVWFGLIGFDEMKVSVRSYNTGDSGIFEETQSTRSIFNQIHKTVLNYLSHRNITYKSVHRL